MANPAGTATEAVFNTLLTPLAALDPDLQRGRKRRRDSYETSAGAGRATIPSSESGTCRGRCRYRSSSRYLDMSSLSRPTSQHQYRMMAGHTHRNTSASPSPSRRKLIRIAQLARDRPRRSLSPSRSRSPYASGPGGGAGLVAPYFAKRRRQRTQSRSRPHAGIPVGLEVASCGDEVKIMALEAVVLPLTTYEVAVPGKVSAADESSGSG
ncbi:hypothetical protein F4777DRAFT_259811 [Nemania sp. FL0916]|nr:hypothetical protein F4777DRAFT_259811 [Nemania sp. FL0916]